MKNLIIAVAALCVASPSFAAAPAAKAEPAAKPPEAKTVTTKGEAAIGNKDLPKAKEMAKEAALREAVMQVVGTFVQSGSETREFTLLQDYVITHTGGYVQSYEVLSEEVDAEADIVTVTVRAKVSQGAIDQDAAGVRTLLARQGQRRVYVAISDVSTDVVGQGGGAQAVAVVRHGVFDGRLREQLRKDGFTCLDPSIVDGRLKAKAGLQSINTVQEANEIANLVGADVVIYGTSTTTVTSGDLGGGASQAKNTIHIGTARTAITVSTTDSAEAIADFVESTEARSMIAGSDAANRAVDVAAANAVKKVRLAFFEAWRKQRDVMHVNLVVTGLRDFGAFGAFKDLLRNQVRGVKEIYSARYEKNAGTLELGLTGTVETLAGEMQGKNFKGQTVQVTKASNNVLELALGK